MMYDLVIIGAGPSGLTASIYASCFHLKHIIIGKDVGGQMQFAPDILNYPGFEEISGKELTAHMVNQVKARGGELVTASVTRIFNFQFSMTNEKKENGFQIETQEGKKYEARTIILATGTERRKLNVPGEIEYTGKGVHYCATCDKQDYDGKICVVVGGGNSAVQAAVEISDVAKKVFIIYRGSELRGEAVWLERIERRKNIQVIYNTVVKEIEGDGCKVTDITISSNSKIQMSKLKVDRIFIEIGGTPGTALVIPLGVEMDPGGYIRVNSTLQTNISGVFAAGDLVRFGISIEQIVSATALGARAAASAFAYLKSGNAPTLWGVSQIKR
jgi:thioredoxin reductase (NADPH)